MKPENIEVYIEELVLHGFEDVDGHRIGQAAEHELGRLLTERGAPPALAQSGEITRLDGGSFETKAGSAVEAIGAQIGWAVYRGLGA